MAPPYPDNIPFESGKNRPIREPYSNVTKVVHDPHVDHLSKNGAPPAAPEQSGSSTTASAVPVGLSVQSLQDLAAMSPDLASQEHRTSLSIDTASFDGKTESSSGSSSLPADDKSLTGTAKHIDAEHAVSHMAPWVDGSLDDLNKK